MTLNTYHLARRISRSGRIRAARLLLQDNNRREAVLLPTIALTPRPLMTDNTDAPSNVTPIHPSLSAAALATMLTPEAVDPDEVREQLRAAIEADKSLTQSKVSRESGVSSTTVSQFLSQTYPGDLSAVAAKLARWLASLAERNRAASLPAAPAWVETRQAQRIFGALRYAQIGGDIAVIYGPAGVSKSATATHYARVSPNCFVVTMTPAHSGLGAALRAVYDGIGLKDANLTAAAMHKLICQRLKGSEGLLIIDEAQHLSHHALDQIRSIHDATGVGLALVGNEQVFTALTGGARAAYLDRLHSRVSRWLALKGPAEADIDALVKAWNINDAACRQQIREVAKRPGALRVLTKTLRLASAAAAAAGRPLCCDDVAAAIRELGA